MSQISVRIVNSFSYLEKQIRNHVSRARIPHHHGYFHYRKVAENITKIIHDEVLTEGQYLQLYLGAWLHDVDETGYFQNKKLIEEMTHDKHFAEKLIYDFIHYYEDNYTTFPYPIGDFVDNILQIIRYVSCSTNHNDEVEEGKKWMLLVQYADRLEAIGEIGIIRCYEVTKDKGNPFYTKDTPRAKNISELWEIATPERFAQYSKQKSSTMIDHYYDKLLHLNKITTNNRYLKDEFARRINMMIDFCLDFGKTGEIDIDWLEKLKDKIYKRYYEL